MDRITTSLLEEFSKEAGLGHLEEDKRFEHFATFLAVSRHLSEAFNTTDLVTGSGGDTGIDAIAIIVNNVLVTDPDLVTELASLNNFIDATFILVQAERSSNFDMAKIGQFGFGAVDFFTENFKYQRNEKVTNAAEIMTAIYDKSSKFKGNPVCRLFYITTGQWVEDRNLNIRRAGVVKDLEKLGIFREIEYLPLGADGIHKLYSQTKNAISREFMFVKRTVIPAMQGVEQAYLGSSRPHRFSSSTESASWPAAFRRAAR